MPITPDVLADARADVASRGDMLRGVYEHAIAMNMQPVRPAGSPQDAARILAEREIGRLNAARLFFVQRDLATHCVTVADERQPFTLTRADLPSDYGLAYFAVPVALNSNETEIESMPMIGDPEVRSEVAINAAAWGIWPDGPKQWSDGALWVTWYSDRDLNLMADVETGRLTEQEASMARRVTPVLTLDNEVQLPFSDTPIGSSDDNVNARATRALRELFLAVRRGAVTTETIQPDRAARRRAERAGSVSAEVTVLDIART